MVLTADAWRLPGRRGKDVAPEAARRRPCCPYRRWSSLLSTGIPNLDLILGGGVPEGDVLLVIGAPGSGKTTLALQMAFHTAARGQTALYVATFTEPPWRLMGHVRGFSFFDESLIGKRLFLLNTYPAVKQDLSGVVDALLQAVKEQQAKLVVLDGLMTIRDLYPQGRELRQFVYELGAALSTLGATTVLTSSGREETAGYPLPEFTMADGIIELDMQSAGMLTWRTIRVSKMRGLAINLGLHTMAIDGNGITVFPRLEAVLEPGDVGLTPERVPLGLPELDAMMGGGPLAGSTTLLAGALGTGKTLLCLHFIMEGVRRGESGLFVGFRESPRQLADKARAFGLDFDAAVRAGRVTILYRPPQEVLLDELTWALRAEIERVRPQRLVVDSIAELEYAFFDERRRRGYMAALAALLRSRGVTALLAKEVPQVVGPELDFSDTPLAVLGENLILLRYVEFRGELYRIVSVLKMRDSDHDRSIRQYIIDDRGIRVLARMESAEGVLTGIARLPSELRVKRRTGGPEAGGLWR